MHRNDVRRIESDAVDGMQRCYGHLPGGHGQIHNPVAELIHPTWKLKLSCWSDWCALGDAFVWARGGCLTGRWHMSMAKWSYVSLEQRMAEKEAARRAHDLAIAGA